MGYLSSDRCFFTKQEAAQASCGAYPVVGADGFIRQCTAIDADASSLTITTGGSAAQVAASSAAWVRCAPQNSVCYWGGPGTLRLSASGFTTAYSESIAHFDVSVSSSGQINCTAAAFGSDPAPSDNSKSCYFKTAIAGNSAVLTSTQSLAFADCDASHDFDLLGLVFGLFLSAVVLVLLSKEFLFKNVMGSQ